MLSLRELLAILGHDPVDRILRDGEHPGTSAIVLEIKAARHQNGAAEAARRARVAVYWESATEG